MDCANTYFINKHYEEQDKAELAYEAYLLKCSDDATELLSELNILCECFQVVTSLKRNDIETKFYTTYLKQKVYGIYEEILTIFTRNCGDYDFDHMKDMIEFISDGTYETCKKCEY